ncbi:MULTISPECIES: MocR-like pyridoxine biosynthesis transcription factor PdxR [Streptomyces]|uniref:PLP-dependent aminotransferase family protein n=1 Tax=Streptomyces liliifuscus TaxID=2797636 RepID=A0A7T7KZB4_9ACTN|nr:PLP-dependent aminotransferase family protein [Streptomyces liliifuscus]QQM43556.1 PLP-dependent aminotransferase family protein [Streptomyces liliifuscus]
MAVRWVGIGPELLIGLDRSSPEPIGQQLQRELRGAIRAGRLSAGERLPSSRSLAGQLQVSRGLVVESYDQLAAEGYLITATGSGTRVAPSTSARDAPRRPKRDDRTRPAPIEVDFEYGIPDLLSFPMQDWLWALTQAARGAGSAAMGDETGSGSVQLRGVLAGYHRRVRAGTAEAEDAIIVNGFRHGLNLVFGTLAHAGHDTVALEDPGPREHDELATRAGLSPIAVPVDEEGVDVEALAASGARAVLVTPAHQCPTGVVLSAQRRRDLIAWAEEVDGLVLEDDYDAEFRYDRQPVGSLQGLAPDRVIALGSVSKTLAPGIRIGWLLAPPRLLEPLAREKHLTSRGVPALDQTALALLIESGRFDRHLRRMRDIYHARRQTLVTELAEHAPGIRLDGLDAGCHALLRLPPKPTEKDLVDRIAAQGVQVYGLDRYRTAGATGPTAFSPALVLGFGNVNESRISHGVRILAAALNT